MSGIRRILFATGNQGKMREVRSILADTGAEIFSMSEAGISADVEENGGTFEENALIKARAAAAAWNDGQGAVLADDSGLEVDALGGEPGIYSARYLGEQTSYGIKNRDIIARLDGVPEEKRTARFVCAIAAVLPDGREFTVRDTIEGGSGMNRKGKADSGMTPSFMCRSLARQPLRWTRRKRIGSATEGKRCPI